MESVRIVLIDSCSMLDESNVLYLHSKKLTAVCPLLLHLMEGTRYLVLFFIA